MPHPPRPYAGSTSNCDNHAGDASEILRATAEAYRRLQTFVERSKWNFRGHEITFERRWELAAEGREVRISEHIIGPKEGTRREIAIPVA
jgi:hypothetical protein